MKYMMIRKLQDEWKKTAEKNNREASALFTYDGFFPGYQDAETKVVFIGRESRFSVSRDRIADDLAWFGTLGKNEGMGNYWNRIFYIFYGIQTRGKYSFEELPKPRNIMAEMTGSRNCGFALMNVSKYLNTGENSSVSDYGLINRFLADSELDKRNFFREELELLAPDIIITANLWDCGIRKKYLNLLFPEKDMSDFTFDGKKSVCMRNFRLKGRMVKLLDTYHFSAPGNDRELFYDPITELLF